MCLLSFSALLEAPVAFAFEAEVKGAGTGISAIALAGQTYIQGSQDKVSAAVGTSLVKGIALEYRKRASDLSSMFFNISFESYSWSISKNIKKTNIDSLTRLAAFYGRRTSSLDALWASYSLGVSQEFFARGVTSQELSIQSKWIYHARVSASLALYTPKFGANAAADTNIANKDSPKVRLEVMGGALSPYQQKIISPYWGWETSGKIIYGNSLQWAAITYYNSRHDSPSGGYQNRSLRFELSLSLDKPTTREEDK